MPILRYPFLNIVREMKNRLVEIILFGGMLFLVLLENHCLEMSIVISFLLRHCVAACVRLAGDGQFVLDVLCGFHVAE